MVRLNKLLNAKDFRAAAKRALPAPMFHYLDGGADDEWTLAENTDAFARYALLPEYLKDLSTVDTTTRVLGADLKTPLVLSPTGMNRLFHHEREPAVARAASKHGVMYSLSTLGTTSMEDVASASSGPKMFQIYVHKDRSLTMEFVERAKAAGYDALCLTVDMVAGGNRERDMRTGFTMPPRLTPSSIGSFITHPKWTFNLLRNSDFRLANVAHRQDALAGGAMGVIAYVNSQFDHSVTWDDAARVIEAWGGPFAIKGILSPADAVRAKDAGASAVMISNHGGRQLDGAAAPIDCVAPMRDAVGGDMELIVDGGVRRGNHVVKALALGANAVSFGRPYLYALAAAGEAGVDRMLGLMVEEIRRSLALVGCAGIGECGSHLIRKQGD